MTRPVLNHPQLTSLYELWVDLCQEQEYPIAAEIDPGRLRPWLDQLVVIDVKLDEQGKAHFRYTFYGRSLAEAFGTDMVGAEVHELPAEQRQIIEAEYGLVRRERKPVARVYTADFNGRTETWERLSLPFFDLEDEVEKLLVAAYRLSP